MNSIFRLTATAAFLVCSGCVSDGPQPPARQTPRTIEQPAGLLPERIVLSAEPIPLDENENGYYDSFGVTVYLFADETRYPLPIHAEGTLILTLTDAKDQVVAKWVFPPDKLDRIRAASPTGLLGYLTTLNINDVAKDRIGSSKGSLSCRFEPVGGGPAAVSRGTATVRIGPTGVSR